jgi:hypothetical protein
MRYLSIAVVAVLLALTTAACGGGKDDPASPPPDPAIPYPLRYKVSSVSQFRQLKGQSQSASDSRTRMAASTWVFNTDGSFTVSANANLFPLRGTFTANGTELSFDAMARNVNAGGSSFTVLDGTLDLSKTKPVLSATWGSGATYGAVVNDTQFSSATQAEYQFSLVLATN